MSHNRIGGGNDNGNLRRKALAKNRQQPAAIDCIAPDKQKTANPVPVFRREAQRERQGRAD